MTRGIYDRSAARLRWTSAEENAAFAKLAEDHVAGTAPLSHKGLQQISQLAGFGYRPKTLTTGQAKHFFEKNAELLDTFVAMKTPPVEEAPVAVETPPPSTTPAIEAAASSPEPLTIGQIIDRAVEQQVADALATQATQILNGLVEILRDIPGFTGLSLPRPSGDVKKKVLLANADANQVASVQASFPFLEVVAIDEAQVVSDPSADLVIGMNQFSSSFLDRKLRKAFGRNYCTAFGGADSAKTVIRARLVNPQLVKKEDRRYE